MRVNGKILFTMLLLLFVSVLGGVSLGYNPQARLIPMGICVALACLLSAQLVIEIRAVRNTAPEGGKGFGEAVLRRRGPIRVTFWLSCLIAALATINYLIVIPVFLFLFVWLEGKVHLSRALGMAVGMGFFYYLVFYLFLQTTLPR